MKITIKKSFVLALSLSLVFSSSLRAEESVKAVHTDAIKALDKAKKQLDEVQKMLTLPVSNKGAVVQTESTNKEEKKTEEKKPESKKETLVLMDTEKGPIKIKLFMDESPITAGNFKDLVERGFYNGLTFHRLIKGFVVQGGCPNGNGTGGFKDETGKERRIKHEKNNLTHNKAGLLAMARTPDPDSASSQFFIDLAPLPSLNAGGVDPYGYVIFGEVVEGMDVVNKIVDENKAPFPGSDGTSNPVKIKSAKVL